ncbi:Kelch repeat-containing protein [Streptomyces phaeochromogenes]|uniref:Kelch repeat-containing protein n=1 Tax=Streptomyces phaeochromogenes TaxID=1923 RepID=UPI0038685D65|nr:Kelch-like protein 17 [Streptomyces phaeochromogenes]
MTTPTVAATGAWTAADDLPTPAAWYGQHDGAVLLDDDSVLVTGGADATSAALDKTAVYDPTANAWQPVDNLGTPRQLHTITRLANGKVLVVGGLSGSSAAGTGLRSAELYDPLTHAWTATGSLTTPRWGHSAALLPDGSVLVAGGSTIRSGRTTTALRSAERYDPVSGRWSPAKDMTDARTGHTAVPLDGGVVLVVGGVAPVGTADDPALAFCELYGPEDQWVPTGSLLRARRHHRATLVSDTTVLVTGGTAPGSPGAGPYDPFSQRSAERYDLATGVWTAATEMPSGRAFHRAVRIGPGQVLVAGGAASDRDEAGYRSTALHTTGQNNTDAWAPTAGLAVGRWAFAAVTLSDDLVLVTGGVARSGLAAADPAVTELTTATELFAVDDEAIPVAGSGS